MRRYGRIAEITPPASSATEQDFESPALLIEGQGTPCTGKRLVVIFDECENDCIGALTRAVVFLQEPGGDDDEAAA